MALFGTKGKSYLGIDIGSSSIKLVELADEGGRPRLMTYGFTEQSRDIIKNDSKEYQRDVAAMLKDLVKRSRAVSTRAVTALPTYSVFSSIISLPEMPKKELVSAVRWEAKKFVPMPLEEMILDWEVLQDTSQPKPVEKKPETKEPGGEDKKKSFMRMLLTAAPKNLVTRYVQIFHEAGIELIGLETEAFALERSLVGRDTSPLILIDIGAYATGIVIFKGGVPQLNRSIDVGGETITSSMMRNMNLDHERAEQFKRDYGVSMGADSQISSQPVQTVLSSIVNEIKYLLNIYQNQSDEPIEKIVFAGGSAFLTNLPQYFSRIFNVKVFVGDPWARIIYPTELKPALQEIAPRFAVALGLAMREIV